MDATNTKKLSLSRETLRILGDEPLKEVAGASGDYDCDSHGYGCSPSDNENCSAGWPLCGI